MVYCWKCGKSNDNDSDFCNSCGADLFHVSLKEILSNSGESTVSYLSRVKKFRISRSNISPILMFLSGGLLWLINFLLLGGHYSISPENAQPYVVVIYILIFVGILLYLSQNEEQRTLILLALGMLVVGVLYNQISFTGPLYELRMYINPIGFCISGLLILRYLMQYSENKNYLFAIMGIIVTFAGITIYPWWGNSEMYELTFVFSSILGIAMIAGGIYTIRSEKE